MQVYVPNAVTGDVCKSLGGPQVCEEGAIALKDVRLFYAGSGGFRSVWPGSGVFRCIRGGKIEGADGNANIEVGEDELDARW